jgi:hypothetical protein
MVIVDKCREAENISGMSYNGEMTREKSEEGSKV